MTCRGGKEGLERTSGLGENKRKSEMMHLAARWRRSNLVILETLRKGNHPGEASVRRGQRKALYRRERDPLKGPHEEAEIQSKNEEKTWPSAKIRGAFNKFPDFFCTGIYNCRKLEIFQYVVTILLMR